MHLAEMAISYQIKKSKHKTEQGEIISEFVEYINAERKGTPYKPVTFISIKMKLLAIADDTQKLREFLSECKDYQRRNGSFSKRFFGSLK